MRNKNAKEVRADPILHDRHRCGCRAFTSRHVDYRRRLVLAGLLPEAIRSRNGETALILKPILEEKSGIGRHSCESTMRRKSCEREEAALIARSFYLLPYENKRSVLVRKLEHLWSFPKLDDLIGHPIARPHADEKSLSNGN